MLWSMTLIQCICGLESKTCITKNPREKKGAGFVSGVNNSSLAFGVGTHGCDTAQEMMGKKNKNAGGFVLADAVSDSDKPNIEHFTALPDVELCFLNPGA